MENIVSQINLTSVSVFAAILIVGLILIKLFNRMEEARRLRDAGNSFPRARKEKRSAIRKAEILDGKLMSQEMLDEHEKALG